MTRGSKPKTSQGACGHYAALHVDAAEAARLGARRGDGPVAVENLVFEREGLEGLADRIGEGAAFGRVLGPAVFVVLARRLEDRRVEDRDLAPVIGRIEEALQVSRHLGEAVRAHEALVDDGGHVAAGTDALVGDGVFGVVVHDPDAGSRGVGVVRTRPELQVEPLGGAEVEDVSGLAQAIRHRVTVEMGEYWVMAAWPGMRMSTMPGDCRVPRLSIAESARRGGGIAMQTAGSGPDSASTVICATLPVSASGHPGNLG